MDLIVARGNFVNGGSGGLFDGADAIAVDLGGDGALEQVHGYDDAKRAFPGADDEAFDTGQGAAIDAHFLAGLEVGPGHEQGMGGDQSAKIVNLIGSDGGGGGADADDLADAGSLQHADAIGQPKAAKEISGKERLVYYLDAVGPAVFDAAEGQVSLDAAAGEFVRRQNFPTSGGSDGIPTCHGEDWCTKEGERFMQKRLRKPVFERHPIIIHLYDSIRLKWGV
jgi:hypothetical protein